MYGNVIALEPCRSLPKFVRDGCSTSGASDEVPALYSSKCLPKCGQNFLHATGVHNNKAKIHGAPGFGTLMRCPLSENNFHINEAEIHWTSFVLAKIVHKFSLSILTKSMLKRHDCGSISQCIQESSCYSLMSLKQKQNLIIIWQAVCNACHQTTACLNHISKCHEMQINQIFLLNCISHIFGSLGTTAMSSFNPKDDDAQFCKCVDAKFHEQIRQFTLMWLKWGPPFEQPKPVPLVILIVTKKGATQCRHTMSVQRCWGSYPTDSILKLVPFPF